MNEDNTPTTSQTDWQRLEELGDEAIDLTDIAEITPDMFAAALVREGGLAPRPGKQQITLRIDADVIAWYRSHGRGYQTRINELLRAYMEAHQAQ